MSDNVVDNYEFMGKSLKDWDNEQQQPTETIPEDKAIEMGIVKPQEETPQQTNNKTNESQASGNKFTDTLDAVGIEHTAADKEYQKLSVGESLLDGAKALGVEASHFFVPKKYEAQYESKTRVGESMKYITRYGLGALGFAVGGGEIGAAIKGIGAAAKAEKAVKIGELIQKAFSFAPIAASAQASKLEKGAAFVGNAMLGGALPSALADMRFYNQDGNEGHLADTFGNSNNPLIQYLQTDENDSNLEGKLKNAVEGFIVGSGMGLGIAAVPKVVGNMFRGLKGAAKATTEEEAKVALKEVAIADGQLQKIGNTADLLDTVKEVHTEAATTGEEASALLRTKLPAENLPDADTMLKHLDNGDDIHINEDGSFSLKVSNWEDAHKVSPESYKAQTPDAIPHMDSAVKSTWTDRGWLATEDDITKPATTKNIVDHYIDKWALKQSTETNKSAKNTISNEALKSKIKVRYVDGLTTKGKAVEGFAEPLKDGVQISIDKNSPNIHAVLRSELEHARDIITNEVPKSKDKHFARYNGKNESEMSADYVYKKSQARAGVSDVTEAIDTPKNLVKDEGSVNTSPPFTTPVKDTLIPSQNEQLKLDFNTKLKEAEVSAKSSDDIVKDIYQGKLKPETTDDINNLISTVAKIDPEISGNTWLDFAKDGEIDVAKVNKFIEDNGLDSEAARELLLADDARTIHEITVRQLAKTKVMGSVKDSIQGFYKDTPIEIKESMLELYRKLHTDVTGTGSSVGRALNAQKVVNEAADTFGTIGLSAMQKEGISEFTDMLNEMLTKESKLFFTRAEGFNLNQIKQNVVTSLLEKGGNFADLLSDEAFMKNLNSSMDDILIKAKREGKLDSHEVAAKIKNFVVDQQTREMLEVGKLATDDKSMWKTFSNWFRGNVPAYYIHNLLSSPTTLVKNVGSGGANSISFAMRKMIAGGFGGGKELTQEGVDQFVGLFKNWSECWQLSKQAFEKGDGLMTSVSSDTLNGMYKGLDNLDEVWTTGTTLEKLQSVHSIMTRAMGASDEFMSQLNYRAIAYAKSLGDARLTAKQVGREGDEEFITQTADRIFKETKFTEAGLPRDVDAFHEAKSILYQNSLTGKMMNYKTGNVDQMRNPTALMKIGSGLQTASDNVPLLKFIIPFIKTPTNILQMSIDHSALALLSEDTRRVIQGGGREAALAKAQIAMGMTSFTIGATMAGTGMITGGLPSDHKERAALLKSGWKPYSFKVKTPDGQSHYVSYQGYEPIATILGTGADLVQLGMIATSDDEDKISTLAKQAGIIFTNNFIDKAYFRTAVTQMNIIFNADAVTPTQIQNSLGSVMAGSLLPDSSGVKNITTLGTVEAKKPENVIQTALTGYLNRGLGQYQRNEFGEKETITNLLLAKSNNVGSNPEDKELRRLAEQGYSPTEVSKVYSEAGLKLKEFRNPETKQSAYDAFIEEMGTVTIGGQTLREAVGNLVMSDEYNSLPDTSDDNDQDTKTKEINAVYQEYIQSARETISTQEYNFVNKDGQALSDKYAEFQQMKQDSTVGNTDIREKLNSIF